MAWRDNYYYRSRRTGDTVQSEYVGTGAFAELAAALDEAERQKRRAQVELERRERQQQDDLDRELAEISSAIRSLVAGVMLATGHRSHKRQWRKKRQ